MNLRLNGNSGPGRVGIGGRQLHHPIISLSRLVDVDHAFEERAFRNTHPLCNHIPDQRTFTADIYTVAGIDVALHGSQNHHFTGTDISRHLPIATNRDAAGGQVDCAHDFAVYIQRLAAYYVAPDLQALTIVTGSVAADDSEGGPVWF
jgi:hypothetical protein